VDFRLEAGTVHAVVGHNGAGKSTLMNILSGVHHPDEGTLVLDGQAITLKGPKDALAQGISMVHQELSIIPDLDVGENVFAAREPTFGLGLLRRRQMYRETRGLLADLGVDVSPTARCADLSVGTRQTIEIARAISWNCKVLILDEPTSALSKREQEQLFAFLRDLKARGIGMIYVSHRLSEIRELADEITVLRDGRKVSTVPARGLSHNDLVEMMIGHPVAANGHQAQARTSEDIMLDVSGLSCAEAGIDDASISARKGEIVGIAGMLGSGRSELFELLFGLRKPDAGQIKVDGAPVRFASPADAMGVGICLVAEDRRNQGIFEGLPIWKNAMLGGISDIFRGPVGYMRSRLGKAQAREQASRLSVKPGGITEEIQNLSGGNQQKVLLARWLLRNPRILLLDEPTAGIDVGAKDEIHAQIRELADQGMTVLFSSSEFTDLTDVCDRILVLREGRIVDEVEAGSATESLLVGLATESDHR
jgi:ABC-type sugar transport system ATPase subunit